MGLDGRSDVDWGIDVSESFIEEGRKLVDPSLLDDKGPRFSVITEELIQQIKDWQPQFIFSHTVLQHVPETELPLYFERLSTIMGAGSKAIIEFPSSRVKNRMKAMSWAYPDELLRAVALSIDPSLTITFEPVPPGRNGHVMKKPRRTMALERP